MIVLGGANQHGNILHVILGPETEFWSELHGASVSNITQVLNGMNHEMPVFLHITKCASETELTAKITAHMAMGAPYPFPVTTTLFAQVKKTTEPTVKDAAVPTEDTPAIAKVKCTRCGSVKNELVPKLDPPLCYDCMRLDMRLANARKPEKPETPPEASDDDKATT